MIYIVAVERLERYFETIEVEAENDTEAADRIHALLDEQGFHELFPRACVFDTDTQIDSVYPKEEETS